MSLDVDIAADAIRARRHNHLKNQLTRSAASVPTNIVEGRAHRKDTEFVRFLGYAVASASETEYHLLACRDKGLLTNAVFEKLSGQVIEVRKMLFGLIDTINESIAETKRPPLPPATDDDNQTGSVVP